MLVDSPCIPGNSGSPVMIEIGSNGIYSGAPNLYPSSGGHQPRACARYGGAVIVAPTVWFPVL